MVAGPMIRGFAIVPLIKRFAHHQHEESLVGSPVNRGTSLCSVVRL